MEKKQSSITHIRSWVRTNGEMSEDGKSITYSCAELESVIREAKAMHNKEVISFAKKCLDKALDTDVRTAHSQVEELYNETFGGYTGVIGVDNISWTNTNKLNNGGNNE